MFGLVRKTPKSLADMSAEVEKVAAGETEDAVEDEELDCSVPEVVNKYQFAGKVANGENLSSSPLISIVPGHSLVHKLVPGVGARGIVCSLYL